MQYSSALNNGIDSGRRKFISNGLKTLGGTALLALPGAGFAKQLFTITPTYTVQNIIDIITKEVPGAPFAKTVDTIKFGTANEIVTGIVTTMFSTVEVIEQAVKLKANFIIAHEPTYYNGQDNTIWLEHNYLVKQKQQLLEANKMTIWRFHDYCHSLVPDLVGYGVLKKMGWVNYYKQGEKIINIPPLSLQQLVQQLKTALGIKHLRVIGDLSKTCSSIGLLPGAVGGQRQVSLVEEYKPDVLIVGEQVEWETTEYIRDNLKLGGKTAMVVLGHSVSEEPGMEYLVEWLSPKLPGVTVTNIPSGDPFTWL